MKRILIALPAMFILSSPAWALDQMAAQARAALQTDEANGDKVGAAKERETLRKDAHSQSKAEKRRQEAARQKRRSDRVKHHDLHSEHHDVNEEHHDDDDHHDHQ